MKIIEKRWLLGSWMCSRAKTTSDFATAQKKITTNDQLFIILDVLLRLWSETQLICNYLTRKTGNYLK